MSGDGDLSGATPLPVYAAAGQGRRLRMWQQSTTGPNSVTKQGIGTIRARARGAARNDPWAGAALDKLTSNGIGTGIQAKALWGNPEFRAAVKKLWGRWTKVADADGVLDFYGMQALGWREWHEAGEVFVRVRNRRESDGLPVPIQLQMIEAEQCPAELYQVASNGNQVRAGVEFNGIGRRVAYWMYKSHPGDYDGSVDAGQLVRVPAEDVIHVFEPLRAGQIRGIPRATSVLVRMFNLDSLDDAVLERQKIANLFAGWYTQDVGAADLVPGMAGEMATATPEADGVPLAGLEPGTMQELPAGMKVEFSKPPEPGSGYADFIRASLQAVAARHGVPYEVLTGDLRDVSDRALRLILNEFRRLIEQWQWNVMIQQLCQPVRERFFDAAVLSGALRVPRYAAQRDDVVETLWVPQGWPYSHPVQDVEADMKAIRSGLTSRSAAVLSTGEDPEAVDAQIAEDNERADSLKLVLDSDPRKTGSGGATQARAAGSALPDTGTDGETGATRAPMTRLQMLSSITDRIAAIGNR